MFSAPIWYIQYDSPSFHDQHESSSDVGDGGGACSIDNDDDDDIGKVPVEPNAAVVV